MNRFIWEPGEVQILKNQLETTIYEIFEQLSSEDPIQRVEEFLQLLAEAGWVIVEDPDA